MTNTTPTIEAVLQGAAGPCGTYTWDEEGGRVTVPREVLLAALQEAYEPGMPCWEAMVVIPRFTIVRQVRSDWQIIDCSGAPFWTREAALAAVEELRTIWPLAMLRVVDAEQLRGLDVID